MHAETLCALGHFAADLAEADDAECFIEQLDTHELLLFPLACSHGCSGLRNSPGCGKHHGDRMFRRGHCIAAGVFMTTIPFFEAATLSTLSSPEPARPTTFSFVLQCLDDLGRTFCSAADNKPGILADNRLQFFRLQAGLDIDFEALRPSESRHTFDEMLSLMEYFFHVCVLLRWFNPPQYHHG